MHTWQRIQSLFASCIFRAGADHTCNYSLPNRMAQQAYGTSEGVEPDCAARPLIQCSSAQVYLC